jgi:hypothetical protein
MENIRSLEKRKMVELNDINSCKSVSYVFKYNSFDFFIYFAVHVLK